MLRRSRSRHEDKRPRATSRSAFQLCNFLSLFYGPSVSGNRNFASDRRQCRRDCRGKITVSEFHLKLSSRLNSDI